MDRMDAGYLEATPSGGVHWLFRLDGRSPLPGNTKLARRPKRPDEMADEHDTVQVVVETRGEGGQVIVAPSHGRTHPSGQSYVLLAGGWSTLPTLTAAEWDGLAAAAARLDELPPAPTLHHARRDAPYEGDSIMQEFNARASWAEILEPHGWTLAHHIAGTQYWRRPGARTLGHDATAQDDGPLYVFSTSTVFEADRACSKFAAYAVLNCGGDMREAARRIGAWKRSHGSAVAS
jgi:putative DNA primase/helicase